MQFVSLVRQAFALVRFYLMAYYYFVGLNGHSSEPKRVWCPTRFCLSPLVTVPLISSPINMYLLAFNYMLMTLMMSVWPNSRHDCEKDWANRNLTFSSIFTPIWTET